MEQQAVSNELVTGYLISKRANEITLSFGPDTEPCTLTVNPTHMELLAHSTRDDIIYCECSGDAVTGNLLITRSLVEKKHTVSSMMRSVRHEDKLLVPPYRLMRLYTLIESLLNNDLLTVPEFLSYKANLYNSGYKSAVLRSIMPDDNTSTPPGCPLNSAASGGWGGVTYSDIVKVLKGWYIKNDLRLLECLGISKSSLRDCYYRPDVLYSLYMTNPMLVHCVPLVNAVQHCSLLGIDADKYMRAGEAVRALAKLTIDSSNTCATCKYFYRTQDLPQDSIKQILDYACVPEACDGTDVIYLKELRDMEIYVAARLHEIFTSDQAPTGNLRPEACDGTEDGMKYDTEQAKAIEQALRYNISIITGAAGTGKTTIVKKILACLTLNNVQFACTSFTGKATARISECCNVDAEDMDLMIVKSSTYSFTHLIIDEFSMTNIKLLYSFLQAFPALYRITIIGDPNQLEPIGPGSMLKELMKSATVPVTRLKTIYRVVDRHGVVDKIIENSKRIAYWENKPFSFVEGDNFHVRDGTIKDLMLELKSMHANGVRTSDFVVISPYKEYIEWINRAVQVLYCRTTRCCSKQAGKWTIMKSGTTKIDPEAGRFFHVGDRVMVLKNNNEPKMHNGQEGIVVDILPGCVQVEVRGNVLSFPFKSPEGKPDITYITLCYAVTVHKMQGSQRKKVIYFLHKYTNHVTRSMTYTAITRAEEEVLMLGDVHHFNKSVNNVPREKKEYLYWRLRNLLPQDFSAEKDERMMEELLARQAIMNAEAALEQCEDDSGGYDDYSD